jgi:hypothetical protein
MSNVHPPELPPPTNGRRYGTFTRAVQRIGHVRSFTIVIRYAGSKLDRVLYRSSGGRITLTGPSLPTMLLTTVGRKTAKREPSRSSTRGTGAIWLRRPRTSA